MELETLYKVTRAVLPSSSGPCPILPPHSAHLSSLRPLADG